MYSFTALLIKVPLLKTSQHPSTVEWIKKSYYIYIIEEQSNKNTQNITTHKITDESHKYNTKHKKTDTKE